MDAQTLGALADIVKEAIAEAVAPLHERIKELESRREYDPQPLAEFSTQATQSLGQMGERLKALEDRATPAAYDDSALIERVKMLESATVAEAYDDSALREQLADITRSINAHAEIVKGYADSLPKPYDDVPLREWVTQQLKELPAPVAVDGIDGQPGADGRDALQLEVLPAIDESRNYPRGTYAKHAGGLWRSFEQTHGMRGWECIVNGVKSVEAHWEGKTLVSRTTLSDGSLITDCKFFPIQEYKNVFIPESEYLHGDTVTWAGSLWHCNKSGTQAKPGDGSPDWTLAVKKGRDGREVVKTERVQGPVQI